MFEYINHEKEMKKIFYRNKAAKCCHFSCKKSSIFSHIISKSISIDQIAENGHILNFSPKREGDIKIPNFELVGVQGNPAFNGFCTEHDSLFKPIDDNMIVNFYGVYLQLYRSISSHIYFSKIGKFMFPNIDIKKAEELLIKNTIASLGISIESIDINKKEKLSEFCNERFNKINNKKNYILENELIRLEMFKEYFFEKINSIKDKLINTKIHKEKLFTEQINDPRALSQIFIYHANFKIPVAVNAINIFNHRNKDISIFYIIIPYSDSSLIIGLIDSELENKILNKILDKINSTFNKYKNSISVLNFVESIIISSPDYSYFTPSTINNMSENKRNIFTHDCMFTNEFQNPEKYLEDYDISIFDEVRLRLNNNDIKLTEPLPTREPYTERYIKMKKKIDRQNPILIAHSDIG